MKQWVRDFHPRLWAFAYPQAGRPHAWARRLAFRLYAALLVREGLKRGAGGGALQ